MKRGVRGIFITFEGVEGSGKTTQIKRLSQRLEALKKSVKLFCEPGGTATGLALRRILLHASQNERLYPETELLLFAAARAQLVRECLLPALKVGTIVLCDRFLDSSMAYQGAARGIPEAAIRRINNFAVGSVVPDLTFIFDVPAELGLQRARGSGDLDRIESETLDFHHKVREGYHKLLQGPSSERFLLIDGTEPEDDIAKTIWEAFKARFCGDL